MVSTVQSIRRQGWKDEIPIHWVGCKARRLGNEQIDNVVVTEAKVPKSQKVRNLLQLTKAVKIDTQDLHIDPAILLIRLLVLVERSEDPVSYFQYELTAYPASIFNGNYMKNVNKVVGTRNHWQKERKTKEWKKAEIWGNRTKGRQMRKRRELSWISNFSRGHTYVQCFKVYAWWRCTASSCHLERLDFQGCCSRLHQLCEFKVFFVHCSVWWL